MKEIHKDELNVVFTLRDVHAQRLMELRTCYGWSSRKIACFVLAYVHEIESILKTARYIPPRITKGNKSSDDKNEVCIFLPMTTKQRDFFIQNVKESNYNLKSFFKMALDEVYKEWSEEGGLNLKKNNLVRKYF